MEISRWREPPDHIRNRMRPGGGGGKIGRFPPPLPGRVPCGDDPVARATG